MALLLEAVIVWTWNKEVVKVGVVRKGRTFWNK